MLILQYKISIVDIVFSSLNCYSIIKLSAPKLNYMIGAGAILLYISIILLVVPAGEGDADLASVLCCMTPWFTAIGYSLCYGTILVKMFRTWYIFNKPAMKKKQVWAVTLPAARIYNVYNIVIG